nr:E-beta-farnesene synthase [Tanacetum cinerariifolium]
MISSVRFTKLIIYYLQSKHKFHLRPYSPLHLPNEEPGLGYLKFSAKETKREVFGMPIQNELITADIQGEQYYKEYLEKVAKHKRYLADEEGSDSDSPALKPAKATKKSKPSAPKADIRPHVTKPASSQQPKPKPAPAKSQEKKRKLVTKTFDKPSPAKRSKPGLVTKQRKPTSSLRPVDESVDEGILEKEPRLDDEEADIQRGVEKSLNSVHDAPRGPLPPVVIREPDSGKFQPLPEVQGKGKEKVSDEQVTRDLLTLQTPKKVSPAEQYIFQRRTPASTEPSGHAESSSIYAALGLTDSASKSNEEAPLVVEVEAQDEGQAGPNPGVLTEGQAGSDPGDDAEPQPQSSLIIHAGLNLEYMDLEATNVSTQLHPEQMDEGDPASSTGTLSSLQHIAKYFSFGELFFNDKPSEAENEKTTTETKAESMVSVKIQQDTSAIPPMTTPVIDLTSRPDSPNAHRPLQATTTETTTTTTTTTTHLPPPQPQQSTTDSILIKRIGEHEQIMANLIQDNKYLEERLDSHGARLYTLENLDIPQDLPEADMKEILHQRIWETKSYKDHEDHMMLYEALEKSMNRDHTDELLKDLAEARRKKKKRRDLPKMPHGSPPHQPPPPPPPGPSGTSGSPGASGSSQVPPSPPRPPSTNQEGQSHGSTTPSSSKTPASPEYTAWTTTDTRLRPSVSSIPEDLHMDDDMAPDAQVLSSDDEDIRNAHIPKASSLASTYTPSPENSLLEQTGDMTMFMDWFYKRQGITELKPQDLKGPVFELVKVFQPNVIHLQYQMEECHKQLTDSVDESIIRHNVSKLLPLGGPPDQMKAAYYPDVGLEQMVPDQMWINDECKYDIAVMYGISHWWFQRQRFYIDRHTSEGDRTAVRTHMRILSVVRIEVFSRYGYDYMKKIVLRKADLNEHIITERDFKYLYPSDFEDLNKYGVQMIMRFNEIHKFSNGTLHQIDEALDCRVKEFKVNRMNPGLNTRFWTRKDVDRSKEFMFTIQKKLKTRRIFRNLESFVGGRVEFQRISLTGFRSCASRSQTRGLKVDKARKESHKSPTKISLDVGSSGISIFTVNTYVSLGCSGNTTRIMRRTLDISLTFHCV